jgi:hypothetical protein
MDLTVIPEGVWANGITPVIVVILLSTGVLVTSREHKNMVKLMEYFRGLVETKDAVIRNQSEALDLMKDAAKVTKQTVETVRDIATNKEE